MLAVTSGCSQDTVGEANEAATSFSSVNRPLGRPAKSEETGNRLWHAIRVHTVRGLNDLADRFGADAA